MAGSLAKPKLKVWVTFGEDLKFGDGRARLLELIEQRGSLRRAAGELAMSYRNAWGYLRDLERGAGFKFVERVPGGGPQGGMRLPPAVRRMPPWGPPPGTRSTNLNPAPRSRSRR